MTDLIEQKITKLMNVGGSKTIVIPSAWIERMQANEQTDLKLRLVNGKHGLFVDVFVFKETKK